MQTHVRPRVMWLPLVLVGSILYWTVAMGLGMTSLSLLGTSAEEDLALQPAVGERINVEYLGHETREFDPRASGTGGQTSVQVRLDDGTGRLPAASDQDGQPSAEDPAGATAY